MCRFYFMSDDELLSVLGTSDPTAIQEHMLKLFDNAAALVFDHGCKAVTGMVSSEVTPTYLFLRILGQTLTWSGSGVLHEVHACRAAHLACVTQFQCPRYLWSKC